MVLLHLDRKWTYISVESFEILVELGLKKIEKFSLDLKKASGSEVNIDLLMRSSA